MMDCRENKKRTSMNKSQPMVSVIVPNYNYARFLDERMRSILSQTYQNFEIIILDDCSTDNSREVIEKYRSNPKVSQIVVNEKNSGGPFIQWDRGMRLAQGELIWIAEADDSCAPTFLEEMIRGYLLDARCTLMFCRYVKIDDEGREITRRYAEEKSLLLGGKHFIREYLAYGVTIENVSSVVFSKRVALEVDKAYMTFPGSGDWLFYVLLAERGKVFHVRKQLDYFRRHAGTTTSEKEFDGRNVIGDKMVYDEMVRLGYINPLARMLVKARRRWGYIHRQFKTDEIRDKSYRLWGITERNKKSTRMLVRLSGHYISLVHRIDALLYAV